MDRINNKELLMIEGGALSGTVLTALVKGLSVLIEVGVKLGSSIRRIVSKKMCSI